MTTRRFFAPGKLVLIGEYAVLDGAPAISLAIDHGVALEFEAGSEFAVHTDVGDDSFVSAALARFPGLTGSFAFAASHPPLNHGLKPGFGGSAAAVSVATFAGAALTGQRPALEQAIQVHQQVQGSGSGADVATSWIGGTVRFQGGQAQRIEDAPTPVIIWSGRSAKTGPRVSQYRQWSGRSHFAADASVLVEGFARDPITAIREYSALMRSMAHEAGVDWMTDELAALSRLAADYGGVAKPSGAGGGDCAIAFFQDEEPQCRFLTALAAAGFQVIPASPAEGVSEIIGDRGA